MSDGPKHTCFFEEGAAEPVVGVAVVGVAAAGFVLLVVLPFNTPSFESSLVFGFVEVVVTDVIAGIPFAPLSEE